MATDSNEPGSKVILPIDQCCLVVQMPSVEEMRREVADITCQMQSIYFDDDSIDPESTEKDDQMSKAKQDHIKSNGCVPSKRHNSVNGTQCSGNQSSTISGSLGRKTKEAERGPLTPAISSSLPRHVQVSEEFVINGKRYRQTYQKRITLERQTTRDIFFLPANTADTISHPAIRKSIEYTSPNFFQASGNNGVCNDVLDNGSSLRPRVDLTVINGPTETESRTTPFTPTVVLRPELDISSKSPVSPSANSDALQQSNKTQNRVSDSHSKSNQTPVRADHQSKERICRRYECARNKFSLHEVADVFRKGFNLNLQRSRSVKPNIMQHVENDVIDRCATANTNKSGSNNKPMSNVPGSSEIVGYMFHFGAWDDKAPVLDPRLPVAMCNVPSEMNNYKRGTIIPNPPEWHHAEVGPESLNGTQSPLVRGRIVACLQRFTQHSLSSGKALHRSTYVQQTRLVRQRKTQQTEIGALLQKPVNEQTGHQHGTTSANESLAKAAPRSSAPCVNPVEQAWCNTSATGPGDKPGVVYAEEAFTKCCSERLQLLQSICPAAAAATILLGHPLPIRRDRSGSDSEPGEDLSNHSVDDLKETRVLVKATSWCAPSLIANDLSPYLTFQSDDSSTPSVQPGKSSGIPQLLLRGGTLDGLLIYALRLSQSNEDFHLDTLFPRVFRTTYPTFTSSECVIEKLIQIYVAQAPVEPGCQSSTWTESLLAASFLVTLAGELAPEHLTARLVLRLARFARLLILDGLKEAEKSDYSDVEYMPNDEVSSTLPNCQSPRPRTNEHKYFADRLLDSLPLLSASAQLRQRFATRPLRADCRSLKNSSHESVKFRKCLKNLKESDDGNNKIQEKRTIKVDDQNKSCVLTDLTGKNSKLPSTTDTNDNNNIRESLLRVKRFLEAEPQAVAEELTRMEEEKFTQINFQELLDIRSLERGHAPTLGVCVEHFNKLSRWARSLLFVFSPKLAELELSLTRQLLNSAAASSNSKKKRTGFSSTFDSSVQQYTKENDNAVVKKPAKICTSTLPMSRRTFGDRSQTTSDSGRAQGVDKKMVKLNQRYLINLTFCHICDILKHLKLLKNFSSLLALVLAIQEVPECLLFKKSKTLLAPFFSYMKPPSFTGYRRDLESASLPYLPYLGLIFQQLIHLDAGNSMYLTDTVGDGVVEPAPDKKSQNDEPTVELSDPFRKKTDKFINVWRCWKHYLILGYFIKRKEDSATSTHKLACNKEVSEILNNFEDRLSDVILYDAKDQLMSGGKVKRSCLTSSET